MAEVGYLLYMHVMGIQAGSTGFNLFSVQDMDLFFSTSVYTLLGFRLFRSFLDVCSDESTEINVSFFASACTLFMSKLVFIFSPFAGLLVLPGFHITDHLVLSLLGLHGSLFERENCSMIMNFGY